MGNLIEWLVKRENKITCRFVGVLLLSFCLAFLLGGFNSEINGHGIIFSSGWFREVFIVLLSFLGVIGLILILAGFSKREK